MIRVNGTLVAATDATLSALSGNTSTDNVDFSGRLDFGTFSPTTETYTGTVENAVTHVKLTPTVNEQNATVKVGLRGTTLMEVASGAPSPAISLAVGENVIDVEVTAESGAADKKTYTVTVTRQAAPTRLTLSTDATNDTAAEDAGTVTVTVTAKLDNPALAGGVSVSLAAAGSSTATSSDYGLPSAFTIAKGDTAATGEVTIVDDDVDEDDETLVLTATVAGLTVTEATLTITDNDDAGVTVSGTKLSVDAGSTATYTVALNSMPTAEVTVRPTSGTPDNATVSAAVTIEPADWETTRTITVTGLRAGASTVTQAAISTDPKYPSDLSIDSVEVTVTAVPPDAPTDLIVSAGDAKLDLSWLAPGNDGGSAITGYDVHYTSAPSTGADAVDDDAGVGSDVATAWVEVRGSGTTASQSIGGLTNDTAYRVRVRAKNGAGASGWLVGTGTPQQADTTGPAPPTFDPADGTTTTNAATNITLTFTEAVRKDSSNTDFTDNDLSGILMLKSTDGNGANIPYSATINAARTIITIDPSSDLAEGDVYVAISNAYYDENGNQGEPANATFTVNIPSTDATLISLSGNTSTDNVDFSGRLNFGTFSPTIETYTATVENAVTHVKLTPTVNEQNATVKVGLRGATLMEVASGAPSPAISLAVGENVIDVEVTAESGAADKKTYTVTVTRQAAPTRLTLSTDATNDTAAEDAGTVTVTAKLDNPALAGGVSVSLAAAGSSTATSSDYGLPSAFTIAKGDTAATGEVTIVDDDVDEDDETLVLTTTVAGLTVTGATLTITDNDDAGVTVSGTRLSVDAGSTATYTVALNSMPTAEVMVSPTSGTPDNATVSAAVTIEPADWETTRTITVTGLRAGASTVTHAAISTDPKYPSDLSIDSVEVTVTAVPPDAPTDLIVSAGDAKLDLSWMAPGNDGGSAITGYDVHYTSAPSTGADAVDDDAGVGSDMATAWVEVRRSGATASQSIDGLTNDTAYRVRVRAKNGAGASGWLVGTGTPQQADTTGPAPPTFDPADGTTTTDAATNITLTFTEAVRKDSSNTDFTDNDLPGILMLKSTDGSGANIPYSATINAARTIITIDPSSDLAEGDVYVAISNAYYDENGNQGEPADATFTVNIPSTDATLVSLSGNTSTDNVDFSGRLDFGTFSPTTEAYTATVENAVTHVKLTATVNEQNATVKVGLRGATLTEVASGEPSPAISLAVGENVIDVEVTAESGAADKKTYTVTVTRQAAPARLTLSTDATNDTATEDAGTVTVTATLDQPALAGGVSVSLAAAGSSTATSSDYGLPSAFTIAKGDTTATGEVTIVDDDMDEDDEILALTTTVAGLTVTGATLTITDNDDAGVTVSDATLSVDAGSTVTYTVALNSMPTAGVTVRPTSGTPDNATVSAAVTIEPTDWETTRTITVTGLREGTSTVTHVGISTDPKYPSDLSIDSVEVTVTRREKPSVPTFDGGDTALFSIAENHQAKATVGATPATDEDGDALTYSLSSAGRDHEAFTIDGAGAIRVAPGVTLDYEAQASYNFTAEVSDGEDAEGDAEDTPRVDDTIEVEIRVQNAEEPPGPPTDLTIAGASPNHIEMRWSAPTHTGARLDSYEVQYRPVGAAQWTEHPHAGTATSTMIGGLSPSAGYEVRVCALGDGTSEWTTAEGHTAVAPPRVSGALQDLTLIVGAPPTEVDASGAFAGDELIIVFTSSDAAVVSFSGAGTMTAQEDAVARLQGEAAGEARVTVTASNAGGSASVRFAVTVRAVSEEEAEALGLSLDGLTRTLLSGAIGVIGSRMAASDNPASSQRGLYEADPWMALVGLFGLPAPGGRAEPSHWTVPGYETWLNHGTTLGSGSALGNRLPPSASLGLRNGLPGPGGEVASSGMTLGGLWDRSFAFPIGAPDGGQRPGETQRPEDGKASGRAPTSVDAPVLLPRWTVWGAGDAQAFSSGTGDSRYDGDWRTVYLGLDRRFGERWLGGVALSRGRGQADFRFGGTVPGAGRLETDLTAIYPYFKGVITGGTELWGTIGGGTGEARNERSLQDGVIHEGDLRMRLAAAGLRRAVADWQTMRLSVLADLGWARLEVDGEESLAGLESTVQRARVGVEWAETGAWSPYLRLNGRYDGGGSMSEAGYETEAGVRLSGARVDFELSGRRMALFGDADYEESGATATLRIKSAPDGTGLSAALTPVWGQPSGMDIVWSEGRMREDLLGMGAHSGMMLNAGLSYGIESRQLRGLVAPTLGYGRGGPYVERMRLGADYAAHPEWLPMELRIGFGLQRHETLKGPAWSGDLHASARW